MRRKKLFRYCLISVLVCLFVSLIPLLITNLNNDFSNNFSYNNYNVEATINEDGSLSMREEFNINTRGKHVYSREIKYGKDSRTNYSRNNQGEFDLSSFKVTVETNNRTISATKDNNNYKYNPYNVDKDIIAFEGEKNDLDETVYPSDSFSTIVEIYLADGIREDTKYILEYRIDKVVNVFNDVAELNWKLIPALDAEKENVTLTINLPNNNYTLATNAENGEIHYYGYGGINSSFDTNKCNNKRLVATSKYLSAIEEMEILCYFPSQMIKTANGTNVFRDKNGEDLILERINDTLQKEEHFASMKNFTLIGNIILSSAFIVIAIWLYIYVYKKYDKELVSSFDNEYYRELPAEYPPAEMGYLYNEEIITKESLNATLMDLIRKKFISIDLNGCSVTDKKPNYKLVFDREKDQNSLASYEKYLLYWYFDVMAKGNSHITLEEIDKFVSKESNAKKYNECNAVWNKKVKEEAKTKNFFDKIAEKGAVKFGLITVIGVVITIFSYISMLSFNNTILWTFIFLVLSLSICFSIYCSQVKRKSFQGNEDYVRWKAFEKFLREFSSFEDYPMPGIVVWEKYLVYATVFGIADLVEKQLRTKFSEMNMSNSMDGSILFYPHFHYYMGSRLRTTFDLGRQTIVSAQAQRMASSSHSGGHGGFGGGSSFGGGGGHSSVR